MATFPTKEADILLLGQAMMSGLTAHTDVYPDPPVIPGSLSAQLNGLISKLNEVREALAAYEALVAEKDSLLAALSNAMRDDLRYAELVTHMNDDLLKLIGWSAHKEKTPLAPPDQALDLTAPEEGPGWVRLVWKKPSTGGAVQEYRVERSPIGSQTWVLMGISYVTSLRLDGQDRGVELQYRVVASNKAGLANPSNVVTVVL